MRKGRTTRSVSCRADQTYIRALSRLAASKDKDTGDLVRSAIDRTYGSELQGIIASFIVDREDNNPHLTHAVPEEATNAA